MDTVKLSNRTEQADRVESDGCGFALYEGLSSTALQTQNFAYCNPNFSFEDIIRETAEASIMKSPLTVNKAYAYFGAMLGLFPPFALFCRIFLEKASHITAEMMCFILIPTTACTIAGYFSGVISASLIRKIENKDWLSMIVSTFFIGMLWGLIAGGLGGLVFLGIGAIPGAIIAAIVDAAAFPLFTIFHRFLKKSDLIEERHFLPGALGIALTVTAFILGY